MGSKKCAYWNCKKQFHPNKKTQVFCSRSCSSIASVAIKRKELKLKAIDFLGGKCVKCGYDKCSNALEFHHVDDRKEFGISKKGYTKSWKKIKNELKKCVLLCANCHREEHYDEKSMAILSEVLIKRKRAETIIETPTFCINCNQKTKNKKFCSLQCYHKFLSQNIPSLEEILDVFSEKKSFLATGKHFNVSDNTVRKWLKKYGALNKVMG